jgi:isopentenyldiphosphate isomerase
MFKEKVDIYDADYNYLGVDEKDKVHRNGLWHRTFHCWIIRNNNKILAQLRGKDKSSNPNLLDISAAGHIQAGEEIKDGMRELEEELGVFVDFKQLINVGYYKWASDMESKKIKPYLNREFCHVFFLKDNRQLTEYKMQEEEVDGLFEIDINSGRKLFSGEKNKIEINGLLRGNKELIKRVVDIEDFVPHTPNIWLKVFNLADDINNKRKYLCI